MTTFEYKSPTPAEIQAIMNKAHQLRAEAMRASFVAGIAHVKSLTHRLTHVFARHEHA